MTFDEALRRYGKGAFTDHDVMRCTGLSVRAWRELLKLGAVHTFTQERGPGRVRLCDRDTFKRMAVIAALNRARFSLAMSGRIAYFVPIEGLLYADPGTVDTFFRVIGRGPQDRPASTNSKPKDRLVRSGQAPNRRQT